METEHQLGLLPHQLRGSLPECVLSMELSNSLVNCTACSVAVSKFYHMTLHSESFMASSVAVSKFYHMTLHSESFMASNVTLC
jgi:hypothetical protein